MSWIAEVASLNYRPEGMRRGRLLLAHPATGWRISLPAAGPSCALHRAILRHAAVRRPGGAGVAVFRTGPRRGEVAALMRQAPVSR